MVFGCTLMLPRFSWVWPSTAIFTPKPLTRLRFLRQRLALTFALDLSKHRRQVLVTDNRGLFFAVRKGRSSNRAANSVITDILFRRLRGAVIGVDWVPTDKNPADIPSRVNLDTDEAAGFFVH